MTETSDTDRSWDEFLARIADAWDPSRWRDLGVVVGCSGGADSVALLRALCQLRQQPGQLRQQPGQGGQPSAAEAMPVPRGFLIAAHFNHALRGAESDADEAFVARLARRQQVRLSVGRATAPLGDAGPHRDEATMRSERLRFLMETAHQAGARYIVLAHTADDNVETVLHHLMRGTGPAGLAGIGSPRDVAEDLVLIRPMLPIGRTLVRDALRAVGQDWREDASNDDVQYRRNWIRHRLIPLIQTEYPSAVDAIGRAIESQRDWRSLVDRLAREWLQAHRRSDDPLTLRRDAGVRRPIIIAALQMAWTESGWPRGEMAREHWIRLAATIQSRGEERYAVPGNIEVCAKDDEVQLLSPANRP